MQLFMRRSNLCSWLQLFNVCSDIGHTGPCSLAPKWFIWYRSSFRNTWKSPSKRNFPHFFRFIHMRLEPRNPAARLNSPAFAALPFQKQHGERFIKRPKMAFGVQTPNAFVNNFETKSILRNLRDSFFQTMLYASSSDIHLLCYKKKKTLRMQYLATFRI